MAKIKKEAFIFILMCSQIVLAVFVGLLTLYFVTMDRIAPNVYVDDVSVGNVSLEQAIIKLEDNFDKVIENNSLVIKYNGNDKFVIKYSEIDASIDYSMSVKLAHSPAGHNSFINLIHGYFSYGKTVVHPVVSLNEGKLRNKLQELASLVNKDAANANIYLKDDKIIKVTEVNGLNLNIDNAVQKIKNEINVTFNSPLVFDVANNYEMKTVYPQITSKDLEGAEDVISRFSTDIKSPENEDSIKIAANAINKVLIYPVDAKTGKDAGVFSFNKYLAAEKGNMDQNNEGYNQVASTLYAAVLTAGIKQDTVMRTPHKNQVDYIDPGLDTVVFGDSIDFKFKNSLDCTLIIFAEVKDNKLTVSLVGKKKDKLVKNNLKIEVEQKYDPPVITVESQDMKPGEKKLVSQGKEGLKVNVYRITLKGDKEVDKKLIGTDKYEAIETMVQIGPNSKLGGQLTTK